MSRRDKTHVEEMRYLLTDLRGFLAAVVSTTSILVGGDVPKATEFIARIDTLLELTKDA